MQDKKLFVFPSLYGVLFILINSWKYLWKSRIDRVSVSLRSIIHPYNYADKNNKADAWSFRLLTEYHSFLYYPLFLHLHPRQFGFRLLTEYYSFLCYRVDKDNHRVIAKWVSVSLRSIIHSYFNSRRRNLLSVG